jgi:NADPH:quinone reductase-like Zn-dependent oxidoreductase
MRALYYNEQKGPSGLKIGELPKPEIAEDEVLVSVKAVSLNHLDIWVMNGSYPLTIPMPHIPGADSSGVVKETGGLVRHVAPGDAVMIFPGLSCGHCKQCLSGRDNECSAFTLIGAGVNGAAAEFVKAPARNVFKIPAGISFEEAACFGVTYTTAWNSLVLRAGIRQGDIVLIHGAGSGAGSAAIQIAKLFHATVITTVGDDAKIPPARKLGADHVINHRTEDVVEAVKRVTKNELADIAIDHVGAATINQSLSSLRRGGTLVTFGGTSGDTANMSLRHIFGKNLTIHGVYVGPRAAVPQYLALAPQQIRPVIDSVYPFSEAQKAFEKMLSRRFFGKIVLVPDLPS